MGTRAHGSVVDVRWLTDSLCSSRAGRTPDTRPGFGRGAFLVQPVRMQIASTNNVLLRWSYVTAAADQPIGRPATT